MRRTVLKKLLQLSISLVLIAGVIIAAAGCGQKSSPVVGTEAKAQPPVIKLSKQTGESFKPKPLKAVNLPGTGLKHPTVIFTFDDGNESDYLLAYPILNKYGIKGTSYVNLHNADHNVDYKLSWSEMKQMYENGWDIGDHTYTHINLDKSTPDQIRRSMEEDNESFLRNGMPVPDVFAYPYGILNNENENIIRQYRKQARLAYYRDDLVDLSNINPYEIPCVSADMKTSKKLKEHEKVVDKACVQGGVIVFRVHCMYRSKLSDTGNQPVQTSSKLFAQLVDYCVKKGCTFTTMDGLMSLYSKTDNPAPQKVASSAIQIPWQVADNSDKYVFYSTGEGLYKSNLDGSGKDLIKKGQDIKVGGCAGGGVYFTDRGKLCRMDETGGQESQLSGTPAANVTIVSGKVYCIQSGNICTISASGSLAKVLPVPKKLLTKPIVLSTDGTNLYLCIFYQQGISDIYRYDALKRKLTFILKSLADDPFILKDGSVITYDGSSVYKQSMQTGKKQVLFSVDGALLDMTNYGDWLVYATKQLDGGQKYINGFNMVTGKTFRLESQDDYFIKTLPSEIVACNSEHNDALSRLTISGDNASLENFQGNA